MKKPTFCGVSADETPTKLEKRVFATLFLLPTADPILPSSRETQQPREHHWESLGKRTGETNITKANFWCKNSQTPTLFRQRLLITKITEILQKAFLALGKREPLSLRAPIAMARSANQLAFSSKSTYILLIIAKTFSITINVR